MQSNNKLDYILQNKKEKDMFDDISQCLEELEMKEENNGQPSVLNLLEKMGQWNIRTKLSKPFQINLIKCKIYEQENINTLDLFHDNVNFESELSPIKQKSQSTYEFTRQSRFSNEELSLFVKINQENSRHRKNALSIDLSQIKSDTKQKMNNEFGVDISAINIKVELPQYYKKKIKSLPTPSSIEL